MRVTLHIGAEKTGTTTIQRFLKNNAARLREKGVLVPSCGYLLDSVSHDKLPIYGRRDDRPDDLRLRLGGEPIGRFRAAFSRDLLGECRASHCGSLVLSSEHCSSRLLFADEIERLRDLLAPIGTVAVLLYLRRQDEMWVSYYSTAVKTRSTEPIGLPTADAKREFLDYDALCTRWAKAFGAEALRVRVFDRREFKGGDLIDDFIAAAGLGIDPSGLERPPAQNRGLDPRMLEFLRRFNRHLPHLSEQSGFRPDPRQGDLLAILERLSTENRRALPPEWRRAIMEEFSPGNSNVAKRFLGREDGRLFREEGRGERESANPPAFTMEDAFEIFARVWAEKNCPGGLGAGREGSRQTGGGAARPGRG